MEVFVSKKSSAYCNQNLIACSLFEINHLSASDQYNLKSFHYQSLRMIMGLRPDPINFHQVTNLVLLQRVNLPKIRDLVNEGVWRLGIPREFVDPSSYWLRLWRVGTENTNIAFSYPLRGVRRLWCADAYHEPFCLFCFCRYFFSYRYKNHNVCLPFLTLHFLYIW